MNPIVEEAIVLSCDSDDNPTIPVLGQKFADAADSLARSVIDAREILAISMYEVIMRAVFARFLSFMAYSCEHPTRRKRTNVDVKAMVKTWVPLIKKLATAHDIDEKDAASSALDEQLLPVLAAPVKEIREFYNGVTAALKADPGVPWAVWKLFDFWGSNVLDKINKEEVIGLKTVLARKIGRAFDGADPTRGLGKLHDWGVAMA